MTINYVGQDSTQLAWVNWSPHLPAWAEVQMLCHCHNLFTSSNGPTNK